MKQHNTYRRHTTAETTAMTRFMGVSMTVAMLEKDSLRIPGENRTLLK